jgi:hypothetical protein
MSIGVLDARAFRRVDRRTGEPRALESRLVGRTESRPALRAPPAPGTDRLRPGGVALGDVHVSEVVPQAARALREGARAGGHRVCRRPRAGRAGLEEAGGTAGDETLRLVDVFQLKTKPCAGLLTSAERRGERIAGLQDRLCLLGCGRSAV